MKANRVGVRAAQLPYQPEGWVWSSRQLPSPCCTLSGGDRAGTGQWALGMGPRKALFSFDLHLQWQRGLKERDTDFLSCDVSESLDSVNTSAVQSQTTPGIACLCAQGRHWDIKGTRRTTGHAFIVLLPFLQTLSVHQESQRVMGEAQGQEAGGLGFPSCHLPPDSDHVASFLRPWASNL